jgi:hypothetical protein
MPKAWVPELEASAKRRFTSRNSFILRALRSALDEDKQVEPPIKKGAK